MTIAKECIGCHSNTKQYGITYNICKGYIGTSVHKLYVIFRDKYCPCTNCLVKVICSDPKLIMVGYMITHNFNEHKCHIYRDKVLEFKANNIKRY
jgi:hypothetical protein